MDDIRLRTYLMNAKGLAVLRALVDAGHANSIARVVVERDRALQDDSAEEIRRLAHQHGLTCMTRRADAAQPLADTHVRNLAVGWRWLLSDAEHTVVFHDSELPRYRGFAPLVTCLVNGEAALGVTMTRAVGS